RRRTAHREPTYEVVFQEERDGKNGAIAKPFRDWADTRDRELPLGEKVHHLDRCPERRGTTRHPLAETERCSSQHLRQLGFDLVARPEPELARGLVVLIDHAAARPPQPSAAPHDRRDHAL